MSSPTNLLLNGTTGSPNNTFSGLSLTGSSPLSGFNTGTASPANTGTQPYYLGSSPASSPLNQFTTSNNQFLNNQQNFLNQYEIDNSLPVTIPLSNGVPATTTNPLTGASNAIGSFAQGLNSLSDTAIQGINSLSALTALQNAGKYPAYASVTPTAVSAGGRALPYTINGAPMSSVTQPVNWMGILLIGGVTIGAIVFLSML